MKSVFVAILLFILPIGFLSCSRQITETEPVDNATPGRRDYIWTVDTITTDPFVNLSRMWGSEPNDLWAVGGCLYHFNGTSWSQLKGYYPEAIFGFAQNDVWAVWNGKKAQFWHYDGQQWSLFSQNSISDSSYISFSNIWGNSPDNIYAVGYCETTSTDYKQVLMHYNGKKWMYINTPEMRFMFYDVRTYENILIFTGAREESYGTTYKVLEFDGNNFRELYSGSEFVEMSNIGSDIYIYNYNEKKVYVYQNRSLVLFLNWGNTSFNGGFAGRSTKDIFLGATTSEGRFAIAHYNGTNIQNLFEFWGKRIGFNYIRLFDNSAVFLGSDDNFGVTFSITGKLKSQ